MLSTNYTYLEFPNANKYICMWGQEFWKRLKVIFQDRIKMLAYRFLLEGID